MILLESAIKRMNRAARLATLGRHKHYDRTVLLAKNYAVLVTGENFEEFLPIFERREDSVEHKQRIDITTPKNAAVMAPALAQFMRTHRLGNIKKEIRYGESTDAEEVKKIKVAMSDFYGENGVEEYLETVAEWVKHVDPNGYVIVEFKTSETSTGVKSVHPYPRLYWSSEVYEVEKDQRRKLEYIILELPATVLDMDGQEMKVTDYILYSGNLVMKYTQLNDNDKLRAAPLEDDEEPTFILDTLTDLMSGDQTEYVVMNNGKQKNETKDGTRFARQQWKSDLPLVQAFPTGYKLDPQTKFQTYISAIHPALQVLIDLLRTKSNFDLIKFLHVMPQKIVALPDCPGEGPDSPCDNGKTLDGHLCKRCGGTGHLPIHSQPNDVLVVPKAKDPKEMIDLSKLVFYVDVKTETFKLIGDNLIQLTNDVYIAIFNNEIVNRQDVVGAEETATKTGIKRDDINNTLFPSAEHTGSFFKFLVKCIGSMVMRADAFKVDNLKVVWDNPKNLQPVTLEELFLQLKAAVDAQAPTFVLEQIALDIATKQYEGDPEAMRKFMVKYRFIPFIGLPFTTLQYMDSRGYVRKRDMVVYGYQDTIFSDLSVKNKKFYDLPIAEQDKLFEDFVANIMKELPEDPILAAVGLGMKKPAPEKKEADTVPTGE